MNNEQLKPSVVSDAGSLCMVAAGAVLAVLPAVTGDLQTNQGTGLLLSLIGLMLAAAYARWYFTVGRGGVSGTGSRHTIGRPLESAMANEEQLLALLGASKAVIEEQRRLRRSPPLRYTNTVLRAHIMVGLLYLAILLGDYAPLLTQGVAIAFGVITHVYAAIVCSRHVRPITPATLAAFRAMRRTLLEMGVQPGRCPDFTESSRQQAANDYWRANCSAIVKIAKSGAGPTLRGPERQ